MKKILITGLLFCAMQSLHAQFNNEWIDYSKTYFKIKVAATGLYRLSKTTLDGAGIGNSNAQDYQLWRNGNQVALFTSAASGPLAANDFIEFYGEKNDGKIDRGIYRSPSFQLTDKVSLFTDTAIYFLTVNPGGNNLRWQNVVNSISGNPTPASNVWATARHDYLSRVTGRPYVNRGSAVNYGEYVYSSAYDQGEMMSSDDIYPNENAADDRTNTEAAFNNLLPYTGGNQFAKLRVSVAGSAVNTRDIRFTLNSSLLADKKLSAFEARIDSFTNISPSALAELENRGRVEGRDHHFQ